MTLDAYRQRFARPPGLAYLDHAATGVLSRDAHAAATGYLDGRAGLVEGRTPNNFEADLAVVERARARAAALVGADVRTVEVQPNTSYGLNLLARGLDWRPGDRVTVPSCEFPSNLLPWRALRGLGVEVDAVPHRDGVVTADALIEAIRPETRVVTVSWVQFLSGYRVDLAALSEACRARDVLLCVDAIQGVGALRLDLGQLGVDLLATGGHKWLNGMQGAGFVSVGERLLDRLAPVRGWLNGPVDWDDFEATGDALHDDATRFRVGTFPTAQLHALDAALGLVEAVGPATVETAVLGHAARLAEGLGALGLRRYGSADPAAASGIVTVEADDPEGLHSGLREAGVVVSMRSRKVRFAPHAHTHPDDVDRALAAVADLVGQPAPSS